MQILQEFKRLHITKDHLTPILLTKTEGRCFGMNARLAEKILGRNRVSGQLASNHECYRIEGNEIFFGCKRIWKTGGIKLRNFVIDVQQGFEYQRKDEEFHKYFFKSPYPFKKNGTTEEHSTGRQKDTTSDPHTDAQESERVN
jgi:hypothetical protein